MILRSLWAPWDFSSGTYVELFYFSPTNRFFLGGVFLAPKIEEPQRKTGACSSIVARSCRVRYSLLLSFCCCTLLLCADDAAEILLFFTVSSLFPLETPPPVPPPPTYYPALRCFAPFRRTPGCSHILTFLLDVDDVGGNFISFIL